MSNISRFICFGSSPVAKTKDNNYVAFPDLWAKALGKQCIYNTKLKTSNSKIARKILTYEYNFTDIVFVSWSALHRYEFRTEQGWHGFGYDTDDETPSMFKRAWREGPGNYEYTEVFITLQAMLMAQAFLQKKQIPYAFSFDTDYLINSYNFKNPDSYLTSIKNIIDWDKVYLFNNTGFIDWAQENNYQCIGNHTTESAHRCATEYILTNWQKAF